MLTMSAIRIVPSFSLVVAALVLTGCAAGDPHFTVEAPAGFWVGMWHGAISWVSLVIGIFADNVSVYEAHNTGGWYDFGFLLGTLIMWGGGSHGVRWQARSRQPSRDQDELARKIEARIEGKIRAWAEAEPDADWDEVGKRVESRLKRKVRAWAEEDRSESR